ncbi:MAG TPA: SpoIIE family protein phosphatase [Bryobacteraceae bacterium]|nr:SpoIIE family protein phosphatase [Bryobacteraceae bacterium]
MSERVKSKYLWFRLTIALGLGLGLLLLVQTVMTYRHVTNGLLRQEAQREADRRLQSIGRAARLMGARDPAALTPVLHELVHEAPQRIAWIRILDRQGRVIAESEKVTGAPVYNPGDFGRGPGNRDHRPDERDSQGGRVYIALSPLRMGPPPFARPPGDPSARIAEGPEARSPDTRFPPPGLHPPGDFVETAIYLNNVSANFGPLRQYLLISCSAAFALMGAVVLIGLRFPHYMRGRRVEEELSLARRVQLDLFPMENSQDVDMPFSAKCVPAWQVGGDLYDVFETDDNEVALVLGDVSGKGLPAALLMGVVQGAVRASTGSGAAAVHEQAAERLNHLLCMKTARERFVSLFWCYFDRENSVLRYINAGHLPPLLLRGRAKDMEIIRLDVGGPVLGLLPGARFTQGEVPVEPGDLLVAYSDGIVEAENANGDEFGEDGVVTAIRRCSGESPNQICAAVLTDVKTFLGSALPQDDQTLLVARLEHARAEIRAQAAKALQGSAT